MVLLQLYRLYAPVLFLSTLLLLGCSDKGTRLDGLVLSPGSGTGSFTTGNGGTCIAAPCDGTNGNGGTAWNDSFITPNGSGSFTIAIQSAALTQSGSPSYTIFDTGDISNPNIITFTPGSSQQIATNPNAPPDGTYDGIQYVLSYIEMTVPVNGNSHKFRLYLAGYTDTTLNQAVAQNDILTDIPGSFNWINPSKGLGSDGFILTKGTNNAWQVPHGNNDPNDPNVFCPADSTTVCNQIPTGTNGGAVDDPGADPYTFTVLFDNPLTASGNNKYDFQLNFDVDKIFFFDSTNRNSSGDIPNNNFNFKPPLTRCTPNPSGFTQSACDGRLDARPPAYFWPGLPAVTASGSGGGGGSTTTTTTTTSVSTTTAT